MRYKLIERESLDLQYAIRDEETGRWVAFFQLLEDAEDFLTRKETVSA